MKKILKRLAALCTALAGAMAAQYLQAMREPDKRSTPRQINSAKREIWVICEPSDYPLNLIGGWLRASPDFAGVDVSIVEAVHERSEPILKSLAAVINANTPAGQAILIAHSHSASATLFADDLLRRLIHTSTHLSSDWLDPENRDQLINGVTRLCNAYPDHQIVIVADFETCRELNFGTEILPGVVTKVKLKARQRISL